MTALADRCASQHADSGARVFDGLLIAGIACTVLSAVLLASLWSGASAPMVIAAVLVLQASAITIGLRARASLGKRVSSLEDLASCDPATGCLNRRGFARALDQILNEAASSRCEVALLALDLDHFKGINDRYGHNIGDAVLFEVAAKLVETVGAQGVVARLGGEEFCVLMPHADAEVAGVMAERLVSDVATHRLASVTSGASVTVSIGIAAERVSSVRDSAALRARADEALYAAKRGGRNRAMLWAPGVPSMGTPAAAAVAIATPARRQAGGTLRSSTSA